MAESWGFPNKFKLWCEPIHACPIANYKGFRQKTANGQAEQDPNLPRSSSNVLSPRNVTRLISLTEWQGKWKCQQGKLTLRPACPAWQVIFWKLRCMHPAAMSQILLDHFIFFVIHECICRRISEGEMLLGWTVKFLCLLIICICSKLFLHSSN